MWSLGCVRAHSTPCHSFMGYVALRALILRDRRNRSKPVNGPLVCERANMPGPPRTRIRRGHTSTILPRFELEYSNRLFFSRCHGLNSVKHCPYRQLLVGSRVHYSRLAGLFSGFTCLQLYYVARMVRAGGPRWLSSFTGIVFNFNAVLWVNLMSDTGAE